jgi:hypothetical protein
VGEAVGFEVCLAPEVLRTRGAAIRHVGGFASLLAGVLSAHFGWGPGTHQEAPTGDLTCDLQW